LTDEIKDFIEKSVHIYKTIQKKSSFFVFKIINFVKIIIFSHFKIRGADLSGLQSDLFLRSKAFLKKN
jgi:hypothetical protein